MIYILYTNINTSDEKLTSLQKYIPHLSTELKAKVIKYVFLKDKCRSILGELLVRYGLCKKFNMKDSVLNFYRGVNGRPFVKNCSVDFSITHSKDYVVCAFLKNCSIGVDIEFIDESFDEVAKLFSEYEYNEYISKLSYKDAQNCFYDIWTKKESLYKMKNENYFDVKQPVLGRNDVVFEKINIDEKYICNICHNSGSLDVSLEEIPITEIFKYFSIVFS